MHTGRNDPCVCGSGRKYKRCCFEKEEHPAIGSGNSLLVSVLIALAAIGVIAAWLTKQREAPLAAVVPSPAVARPVATDGAPGQLPASTAPVTANGASTEPASPPSGPAPPGKVWSAEHGHYHDAPVQLGGGTPMPRVTPPSRPVGNTPQPPGPVPAGKVWSAEHGHWHDASQPQLPISIGTDGKVRTGGAGTPPPGPAPAGQVWSAEHGHWHRADGVSGSGTTDHTVPGTTAATGTGNTPKP